MMMLKKFIIPTILCVIESKDDMCIYKPEDVVIEGYYYFP